MMLQRVIRVGLLAISVSVWGCGGGVIQRIDEPPPPPSGSGALQLVAQPASAVVYIDGEYRGALNRYRAGWLSVAKGVRRIAVKARNHYTWYDVITIGDEPQRRTVRLLRKPAVGD